MKYAVITLPRSRSAWMAEWLGVEHEPLSMRDGLDNLPVGLVDTASAHFFLGIWTRWPAARYVFVFRPLADILRSAEKLGLPLKNLPPLHSAQETAYAAVRDHPNVRAVDYDALSDMDTLARLWSFLKCDKFDEARTRALISQNIQSDLATIFGQMDTARMQRLFAHGGVSCGQP